MGEREAFTVLFSKVTAADILKKNQDFASDMAQVFFFFPHKRPKNRMTVSAMSAYKGTLVV